MSGGRFVRVHRDPRPLSDSERLQVTIALAAIVIALELWWGERLGFGLGIVAGWVLSRVDAWLERRAG